MKINTDVIKETLAAWNTHQGPMVQTYPTKLEKDIAEWLNVSGPQNESSDTQVRLDAAAKYLDEHADELVAKFLKDGEKIGLPKINEQIVIAPNGNKLSVKSPYSKELVNFAHEKGAKWDRDVQAWTFTDVTIKELKEELAKDYEGYRADVSDEDDVEDNSDEEVTVNPAYDKPLREIEIASNQDLIEFIKSQGQFTLINEYQGNVWVYDENESKIKMLADSGNATKNFTGFFDAQVNRGTMHTPYGDLYAMVFVNLENRKKN